MRVVSKNVSDKYEIGENIRTQREAQHLSQDRLADLLDVLTGLN